MIPFEKEVSLAVTQALSGSMEGLGTVEDSSMAASPEGGFVWVRLKDGRSVRVTFQVKVDRPDTEQNFRDSTTIFDPRSK